MIHYQIDGMRLPLWIDKKDSPQIDYCITITGESKSRYVSFQFAAIETLTLLPHHGRWFTRFYIDRRIHSLTRPRRCQFICNCRGLAVGIKNDFLRHPRDIFEITIGSFKSLRFFTIISILLLDLSLNRKSRKCVSRLIKVYWSRGSCKFRSLLINFSIWISFLVFSLLWFYFSLVHNVLPQAFRFVFLISFFLNHQVKCCITH